MDVAVKHAISSPPAFNVRISAILVFKNKIISFGTNQEKSHPLQDKHKRNEHSIYLHAEVDAIRNAFKQKNVDIHIIRKSTMYVARVKQKPHDDTFYWGLCKPCSGCRNAIETVDIKEVYYTTNEETMERLT